MVYIAKPRLVLPKIEERKGDTSIWGQASKSLYKSRSEFELSKFPISRASVSPKNPIKQSFSQAKDPHSLLSQDEVYKFLDKYTKELEEKHKKEWKSAIKSKKLDEVKLHLKSVRLHLSVS